MKKFMALYQSFIVIIGNFLKFIGIFLLVAMVLSIFMQVVSRYVFGRPHMWVEEFATYCFIWTVFIGSAYALIKRRHIVIRTLVDYFPERVKELLEIFVNLGMLIFLYFALKYGMRQFRVEAPQSTIALPVKLPRRLFYSMPFIISMFSMFITTVYSFIENIISWKKEK